MIASLLSLRVTEGGTSRAGAYKPLALENSSDSRQQVARRIGLQDITSGARVQGFFCDFRRAGFAHEEDFRSGGNFSDSSRSFNSVYCRKPDIQQDQVWLQFLRLPNCFLSVRHFADRVQVRQFLQLRRNESKPGLVVFYYENPDCGCTHMRPPLTPD